MKKINSVKLYFSPIFLFFFDNVMCVADDDDFNWNYGLSLASSGDYMRAEEALLQIKDESYRDDFVYRNWLARCFIMNDKPERAWDLYIHSKLQDHSNLLLDVIANDCYRKGHFLIAAKAFDKLHADTDKKRSFTLIKGLKGACMGVLKQFATAKSKEVKGVSSKHLDQVLVILRKFKDDETFNIVIKKIEGLLSTISA